MGEGEEGDGNAQDQGQDLVAYVIAAEELDNSDEERRRVRRISCIIQTPISTCASYPVLDHL